MRGAFDTTVERHGPTVLCVCRAVLGPGADADDAWSETFLSALRAWPDLELEGESSVEAWLVRVAHRRCVDVVRRRVRSPDPVGHGEELEPAGADAGAGSAPGAVHDEELWARVAALPRKQRMCVAYRYLGGLAYGEIAELVGGTAAAVRRAASDGVAALRAEVGQWG